MSDLKKHIGFWMRLVSNHVSHAFARKLADQEVTVAEWVILREMYACEGAIAPSHLSERTGLTRGAISKLVDRLLQKRLLTRKSIDSDRRFQDIQLTASAKALVPKLVQLADENDERFFAGLTGDERKTLIQLLMKIAVTNKLKKLPVE